MNHQQIYVVEDYHRPIYISPSTQIVSIITGADVVVVLPRSNPGSLKQIIHSGGNGVIKIVGPGSLSLGSIKPGRRADFTFIGNNWSLINPVLLDGFMELENSLNIKQALNDALLKNIMNSVTATNETVLKLQKEIIQMKESKSESTDPWIKTMQELNQSLNLTVSSAEKNVQIATRRIEDFKKENEIQRKKMMDDIAIFVARLENIQTEVDTLKNNIDNTNNQDEIEIIKSEIETLKNIIAEKQSSASAGTTKRKTPRRKY
jgi:hypothetical protein